PEHFPPVMLAGDSQTPKRRVAASGWQTEAVVRRGHRVRDLQSELPMHQTTDSFLRRCGGFALGGGLIFGAVAAMAQAPNPETSVGDPVRGKAHFQESCALCHATGPEKQATAGQGPLLAGIVGRHAASLGGFGYTAALRASALTWDIATLDRFLAGPQVLVPGTAMLASIADATDRRDIVGYL